MIAPGRFGEHVDCTLVEDELGLSLFKYRALSYTWGDASTTCAVTVNNQELLVTEGLFDILSHLRSTSLEFIIWIDAICINQTDIIEESRHVQSDEGDLRRCRRASSVARPWKPPS